MKLRILAGGLLLLIVSSCSKDDSSSAADITPNPANQSKNKIMVLGASRVEGNRPEHESFRYDLWKDLIVNNWTFDYIGTQSDNGSYPVFNNSNFDTDHEGRGGWTSGEILDVITNSLTQTGAPDIVLYSSPGGNDALQNLPYSQALANVKEIVDAFQNANPDVTIIIEQLAPAKSDAMTPELTSYFNQIKQDILTIASEKSTPSSEVIAVDMFTGFTDNFYADDVHYNTAGADFIASRYYAVLENVLEE